MNVASVGKAGVQQRGYNDRTLQTPSINSRRYAERSRTRRLPEDRGALGPPTTMQNVRHVGCCDDSPNKHATKHFHATAHPIIEGYDPPEGWGWCYVDEVMFDLSDRATPQDGPIPRYY
jgi:hypothetical protein